MNNADHVDRQERIRMLEEGRTALGIELGSTRIKAVLIDESRTPLASGGFGWENRCEDGVWTYHLDDVWAGLQSCFAELSAQVREEYGVSLTRIGALGISAMMHGYLAFDEQGNQLTPFRTWRNTMTEQAAAELTELFQFNIPQRWSIAHLYQAMLNGEEHVQRLAVLTTLSGYVHWRLTGEKVMGVGEASGMFPIDNAAGNYNPEMIAKFNNLAARAGYSWTLEKVLPRVLTAGERAGTLTPAGALLLDPTGRLLPGIPLCPPEGDAGTGMVATNSVAPHTGNVSAGTSIFAMAVLDKPLSAVYPEIDMVTTPAGAPVAMVHCNTCTSDLDAWVRLFGEVLTASGHPVNKPALYDMLYEKALEADEDCGGLLCYNCYSGEPVAGLEEGRPLLTRHPGGAFTLAGFMRAQLFSTMGTLRIGMDILFDKEQVRLDQLLGHGGLFKTPGVGQRLMAAAMGVPVVVMETAGEGGAWGIALLADYMLRGGGENLEDYLAAQIFGADAGKRAEPEPALCRSFDRFMARYIAGLPIERAAGEILQ